MPSRSRSASNGSRNPPSAGSSVAGHDASLAAYHAKRDFAITAEPAPRYPRPGKDAPMFVVQKHRAHRAELHWDFRLEHGGVLWSWAVRKGPSLDPKDKRIAAHVEDHPIDYADFQGTIPDGQYGAGTVETWDRGTWQPLGDPEAGMRDGEIKFVLAGQRLNGKFTLVRLRPRPNERRSQDNWLLIKGHDEQERAGADAETLEAQIALPAPEAKQPAKPDATSEAPTNGARRGKLPERQSPQLAQLVDDVPAGENWLTEIKFDGYRLLLFIENGNVRVVTRNGHDWTDRLPAVAAAAGALGVRTALLDGELVALDQHGLSSFPMLQAALSAGRDETLNFYVFDLLHLNGWDLRPCALTDRKSVLAGLRLGEGMIRYSDHHQGDPHQMRRSACEMKLEGVICKRGDAPYQAGRDQGWLKVKCQGREEFVVVGWTPPGGSRTGFGSLHLGYYDARGGLHYAGGCGSGFSGEELTRLAERLGTLAAGPPKDLLVAGDPLEPTIRWVKPELVAEVQFTSWSGAGRIRHGVYLGLREDKSADEVVMDVANGDVKRDAVTPRPPKDGPRGSRGPIIAVPPKRSATRASAPTREVGPMKAANPVTDPDVAAAAAAAKPATVKAGAASGKAPRRAVREATGDVAAAPTARVVTARRIASDKPASARKTNGIVIARAPKARNAVVEGVTITHPDRELWPGITKQQLAEYWVAVADHALPGLAHRPLAIMRCPEGVGGEHFFQKHASPGMAGGIREGSADKAPFLAFDDLQGLVGMAQISAIELHAWGAAEADPLRPDQIVFDLDPGEGVTFPEIVDAALDVRKRVEALGLAAFCRTTGGKGLHVVVPLKPDADWGVVKPFCRAFAETMGVEAPEKYLSTIKIADRRGRILVDWLRNGLGATAVASFCPRARPGAGVATPLAWDEITRKLEPSAFNLRTVPKRLAELSSDPWADFEKSRIILPQLPHASVQMTGGRAKSGSKARIVEAKAPRRR